MARLVVTIALLCAAATAQAAVESELVRQGVAAYNDLDYPRAIDLLQKALEESLTREEKVAAFQTLAFAHVALDQHDAAVRDFVNLLKVDRSFELNRTISPRVRAVLEEAKARVATDADGDGGSLGALPSLTPKATPGKVKEGQPVTIAAAYPGGLASKVELFHRTRGQQVYSKMTVPVDAAGKFSVTIPGMATHAPAVEYYLVVLDDGGVSVAVAGRLGKPLAVDVEGVKKPVYKTAWFWGVIGGVAVVGAGVATAVALTTRSSINSSTPATISIQPH